MGFNFDVGAPQEMVVAEMAASLSLEFDYPERARYSLGYEDTVD
jgi:hypothetical protein